MNANTMRTPLIKSAVVLLVFVLLAYLTSASPEGSLLGSIGMIIIGAFRLVQWALAMAIGLTVCIAFLIGIFLFAVAMVNKETAASMYAGVKQSVAVLLAPVFSCLGSYKCKESQCAAPPVQVAAGNEQLKDDLQTIIADEVKKVTENQQVLSAQFTALNAQMQAMEEKSSGFAAAGQLDTIASEIAASGKILGTVQATVTTLESKLGDTVQQLQTLTPEKILGDIPVRLDKLEQPVEGFDPQPLTESIQALQKEVEEIKKKNTPNTKAKKRT
jgi:hypothetical protein